MKIDLAGTNRETDSDGHEKEMVGWYGHVKRRYETENIIPVVEMKMGETP